MQMTALSTHPRGLSQFGASKSGRQGRIRHEKIHEGETPVTEEGEEQEEAGAPSDCNEGPRVRYL